MSAPPFQLTSFPTILHHFAPRLVAIEHLPSTSTPTAHNFILFLGGLGDGLRTVDYPLSIAHHLTHTHPTYTVIELLLTSSYSGWQTSHLARDAAELATAIAHFRRVAAARAPAARARLLLLGHSTGCQIAAHYLVGPWQAPRIPADTLAQPHVDGVILQAGISDREALGTVFAPDFVERSLRAARAMVAEGRGEDQVPADVTEGIFGGNPSARRWLSLLSKEPAEADDDYFSSDLGDGTVERIWGRGGLAGRGVPVMVLLSGSDEHMPPSLDKEWLVKERWGKAVTHAGGKWCPESGVVKNASHNLNGSSSEAVSDLCKRVAAFVIFAEAETGGR